MTALPLLQLVLAIPLGSAACLALIGDYRWAARLNVVGCLATFLASATLFHAASYAGSYLLLDDLNVVFLVLNNFVGFTTAWFSASYIRHEVDMAFYMTERERSETEKGVLDAVEFAFGFVQARNAMRARG